MHINDKPCQLSPSLLLVAEKQKTDYSFQCVSLVVGMLENFQVAQPVCSLHSQNVMLAVFIF